MDGRSSRILDMGSRALVHGRAHPDSDAGFNLSLGKLEELVARGRQAATVQREAVVDRRTSSAQKQALRSGMSVGPIDHLAVVGRLAAKENAELGKAFQVKPSGHKYASFLTTARAMHSAAVSQKEVLVKYG
ncbi:MAG TPA: hypothetical protein VJQ46_08925, partial [Gemmatimonadales bacterium]|nr:hypothetical protein [Gemmatimonadales bacterium]